MKNLFLSLLSITLITACGDSSFSPDKPKAPVSANASSCNEVSSSQAKSFLKKLSSSDISKLICSRNSSDKKVFASFVGAALHSTFGETYTNILDRESILQLNSKLANPESCDFGTISEKQVHEILRNCSQ